MDRGQEGQRRRRGQDSPDVRSGRGIDAEDRAIRHEKRQRLPVYLIGRDVSRSIGMHLSDWLRNSAVSASFSNARGRQPPPLLSPPEASKTYYSRELPYQIGFEFL